MILTGQGSTNDVTIKNDADADVLVIPTGTTNVDVVGVATAASFEPDGDTAAGDNAAIGYTSGEGLILTGQGSSTDVTVKNDADATVMSIATGTTQATFAGEVVAASLDISGAIDVDGTSNLDVVDIDGAVQIDGTVTVGVDGTGLDVKFFGDTSGKSLLWDESADSLIVTGTTSLDGAVTINDNSADVDTRIESNGNANMFFVDGGNDRIGIGTATPDYTVELEGAAGDHVTPTLALTNSQAGGYGSSLVFVSERSDDNSHNVAARIQTQGAAAWNSDANTGSSLIFSTVRADTLTEACRMTTEGDFYIAATAVQGAGGCTFDVESRGVNQTFNQSSHADNNEFITFRNSGTQIGSITAPNSSTTAYNTSSDYRLKENVDYSWDATTRLKQLKPARFNWIADSSNTLQDGFLAHEVSSIVPESVGGDKDATETYTDDNGDEQTRIKPQQMDLAKLVPLLVKTIQELEARIAALEA